MTRWARWHADYDDPGSDLAQRLLVVQQRLRLWLDAQPPGIRTVVSMCAGQAADVVGAFGGSPRSGDLAGALVELDLTNADRARTAVLAAGLGGLEVRQQDAGTTTAYVGLAPADLLLVCGVFGNVPDEDVAETVRLLPSLCAPGAQVVWTRHRRAPDLTPWIGQLLATRASRSWT